MTPEERKFASETLLREHGVAINPTLPLIESDDEVVLRSRDEVLQRFVALWAVVGSAFLEGNAHRNFCRWRPGDARLLHPVPPDGSGQGSAPAAEVSLRRSPRWYAAATRGKRKFCSRGLHYGQDIQRPATTPKYSPKAARAASSSLIAAPSRMKRASSSSGSACCSSASSWSCTRCSLG
jgi:Domain of unknown function (DUF4272)